MAKILLFVSDNCPACPSAKKKFEGIVRGFKLKEGVDYEIINIDEGDNFLKALRYRIAFVPSLVVDEKPTDFEGLLRKLGDCYG